MSQPMPMLLDADDRRMFRAWVFARLKRDHPDMRLAPEDLRAAVRAEAEAMVAEGGFVFQDGAFIRWPPLIEFEPVRRGEKT